MVAAHQPTCVSAFIFGYSFDSLHLYRVSKIITLTALLDKIHHILFRWLYNPLYVKYYIIYRRFLIAYQVPHPLRHSIDLTALTRKFLSPFQVLRPLLQSSDLLVEKDFLRPITHSLDRCPQSMMPSSFFSFWIRLSLALYLRLPLRFRLFFNLFSRLLTCKWINLAYLSKSFPAWLSSIPLPA